MSTRAAVRDERAPLLVSEADAALGREAKDAGRRLPAVLACVAVGFLVALVSLSVTVAPSAARTGGASGGSSTTPRRKRRRRSTARSPRAA